MPSARAIWALSKRKARVEIMRRPDKRGIALRVGNNEVLINEHQSMRLADKIVDAVESWEPR